MTKKDYIKFAGMLAKLYHLHGNEALIDDMRILLVAILEADNSKFDTDKFNRFIKASIMKLAGSKEERQLEFKFV